MTDQPVFRVFVDGTTHPVHDGASGVRIILGVGDETAEVQVARVGGDIVVVAAGLWGESVNDRGHLVVSVAPTPGVASGPESSADWYGGAGNH